MWNEAKIVALLETNNRAVEKAIVAIYNRQTADEKLAQSTRHDNKMGFSAAHAAKASYYARWILSGRSLTGKHLSDAREIAIRYRKQLLAIANQNNSVD